VKSASRATRNTAWWTISVPGKSFSRWRSITSSSGTNAPPPMSTRRGTTSFGTFTRANVSVSVTGSRTQTATLRDRFEM
jgi:hypothetical protein